MKKQVNDNNIILYFIELCQNKFGSTKLTMILFYI